MGGFTVAGKYQKQSGAVSLFVVVFTAMLITIVTIAFTSLMLRDQQQAMVYDLSQQAYDSANAGVEDAKRALLKYKQDCKDSTAKCSQDKTILNAKECDTLSQMGIVASTNYETLIQQAEGSANANTLDQAYTCVTVTLDTDDYEGSLIVGQPTMVPLQGKDSVASVDIEWFTKRDFSSDDPNYPLNLDTTGDASLYPRIEWPTNRPPVLRAQQIQYGGGSFSLDDLDSVDNDGDSNSHTKFLYPSAVGLDIAIPFSSDSRQQKSNVAPELVKCYENLSVNTYACKASLKLSELVDSGSRSAYLNLMSIYSGTTYRVQLKDADGNIVKFDGVQPKVDSNGRANDIFRRVEARVQLYDDTFPYPRAALDVDGNVCKNFVVTDKRSDYTSDC